MRPTPDRRQADTRRAANDADDPLIELARIVAGKGHFDSPAPRNERPQQPAPRAPLPSESDLARDLESELLEPRPILLERLTLGGTEMKRHRKQQSLRRLVPSLERAHELIVQHALVRRVLVDENDSVVVLEHQVAALQLHERRNVGDDGRR